MTRDYNFYNKALGWLVFLISLTIYWLTVEPTVSYWDAGEYIATGSSLQVGHPPGAPLYQMIAAFFSTFAFDKTQIAYTVNLISVFSSAFTIMFMFWSVTLLLKRHIIKVAVNNTMVLGAAFVGSLAFAVSDSFWFNAAEAEVYAMTAMLMSLLFYLGLIWERDMLLPRGNRWLVLISFIIGLSFGVHFLGLLTIPAIGLLWYFRHYREVTVINFIVANIAVVAALLFVFLFLGPYTLAIFGYLEIFFVNDIGLPFNSGTIIALVLLIALFVLLLTLSRKRNKPLLHTFTLCTMFVLVGFSSWTMLPIRANAGTPINENNPNDARALLAYYNREQYGETSLFYGESFTDQYAGLDPDEPYIDQKPKYEKDYEAGKYVIVNEYKDVIPNTHNDHKGFLPRMTDGSRASNYIDFMGGINYSIKPEYQGMQELVSGLADYDREYERGRIDAKEYVNVLLQLGEAVDIEKPTLGQNLSYMLDYQVSYMYVRYFMWNFVGRQNDEQGKWDRFNGNWISGIPFIDNLHIGSQENLSSDMQDNKGRNRYFFLPLLLGLIGAIWHAQRDVKSFYVVLALFLCTGLAIIIYLNQAMFQVRERDYAYIGSFLVFSMWIGMGVYAIYEGLRSKINNKAVPIATIALCFLAIPFLMAFQNWDDHDRSDKYIALANGRKYLDSCLPNALIFTIGDNDTFPLWYLQEVEGYRTDVRVVCTSLLSTDWYMNDMKKKAWDSEPVPSTLTHDKYKYGTRDALWYADKERIEKRMQEQQGDPNLKFPDTMALDKWMEWVASDARITQERMRNGYYDHTFPTRLVTIPVNKKAVLDNGVVTTADMDLIVDEITINIKDNLVYKNRMLMLDIILANDWERPIYFSGGAFGDGDFIWMKDYLQMDGCAFRLTPIKSSSANPNDPFEMGRIDALYNYDVMMNWDWGNSGQDNVYHDPETRRNSVGYRNNLTRTAMALAQIGELKKSEEILDLGMEKMPLDIFEHYAFLEPFISGYYELGKANKARDVLEGAVLKYQEKLDYLKALPFNEREKVFEEIYITTERYRSLVQTPIFYEDEMQVKKQLPAFNDYIRTFTRIYNEDDILKEFTNTSETNELEQLLEIETDNTDATGALEEELLLPVK